MPEIPIAPSEGYTCELRVNVQHTPLAFIYEAFTPTITVDGNALRRQWGSYRYAVEPGAHTVSCSYPWILMRECGKNSVDVHLSPGEICTVTYTARLTRYIPGKMTVEKSTDL